MPTPIRLFLSYAARDDALREELEIHLRNLARQGLLDIWHRRRTGPGEAWQEEVAARLDAAQLVLLLVSADYLAAEDCFDLELRRALDHQRADRARVLPVILRPCDWKGAPFATLAALPSEGRPVTSWPNRDEAWVEIARGVREAAEALQRAAPPRPRYDDAGGSALAEALQAAYRRRSALAARGFSTDEVDREIRELRRRIREGGQLRPGDQLGDGRFLMLERIGQGGFGVVWRAYDQRRDMEVAIKVLQPMLAGDPIRRERFYRGVRAMARLEHEAVVRVLDPGSEDEGYHYFVMELLPGGDLRRRVLAGTIDRDRVIPLILRVGEALAAAHARGLVHRDVKPGNILLDEAGDPRLSDFDLVADPNTSGGTRTGPLGTFVYAPPEMLDRPQDAGPPADVYGLAMTAVFGLHGRDLPLDMVRDPSGVIGALRARDPVKAVLKRALSWSPSERHDDARAFCDGLRRAHEHGSVPPPSSVVSGRRPLRFARRDLRGTNLSGRDLRGADIREADLRGAELLGADLSGADLSGARVIGASLSRATLAGTRLERADLSSARLVNADLRGAELDGARLRYAALVGAELDPDAPSRCDLFGAALPGAAPALELVPLPSPRRAVAVSPDGYLAASAHADGSLRLSVNATGAPLRTLDDSDPILTVAFSPDGMTLATGSADGTVLLWDPSLGAERCAIRGHLAEVLDVAWSPDGAILATASADGTLRLWEAASGAARATLDVHEGAVRTVAWDQRGAVLATGSSDGTARLWDPATAEQRALFEHDTAVSFVAISPDGSLLATGTQDGTVRIWDLAAGAALCALEGHNAPVWGAVWSRDGALLATRALDDTVRIWDLHAGFQLRVLPEWDRHAWREAAFGGSVSADGGEMAGLIRRLEGGPRPADATSAALPVAPLRVSWSAGGEALVVQMADGSARRWEWPLCTAGEVTATLSSDRSDPAVLSADVEAFMATPPDRVSLVSHPDGTARVDVRGGASRLLMGHTAAVSGVALHPHGALVASASLDGTVRLWDERDRCVAILLVLPGGWAALRPDGRFRLQGLTGGAFWHTIGLCRFEPGELDGVLPTPLRLAEDEALVPASAAA